MFITGTHFNYYLVCHRKLWLFATGLQMEHNSELVGEGKLIHETSYSNRSEKFKELALDGIKIDYYDAKNKIIHEIKKSDKKEEAHIWQLKYYIYVLQNAGIDGVKGILEYPTQRKKKEVFLNIDDSVTINKWSNQIRNILNSDKCPDKIQKSKCRNCSYFDFCWVGEEVEED